MFRAASHCDVVDADIVCRSIRTMQTAEPLLQIANYTQAPGGYQVTTHHQVPLQHPP